MPAQLEIEEDIATEEHILTPAERRERNAVAIAEVVGRNPAHTPARTSVSLPVSSSGAQTAYRRKPLPCPRPRVQKVYESPIRGTGL
jgi:hypothetical protein